MATQKTNTKFWIDESGIKIPYSRTTKVERLMEKKAAMLLKEALKANEVLSKFKELTSTASDEVYNEFLKENNIEKASRKGNFAWYNFDRSIKVDVSINEIITFDDLTITAAKEKLSSFLNRTVDSKVDFVKELIIDAFNTSRGKLDVKKVLALLKYQEKIKDPEYTEAMQFISKGIRRNSSKTYHRISVKNKTGEYEYIELNYSALK